MGDDIFEIDGNIGYYMYGLEHTPIAKLDTFNISVPSLITKAYDEKHDYTMGVETINIRLGGIQVSTGSFENNTKVLEFVFRVETHCEATDYPIEVVVDEKLLILYVVEVVLEDVIERVIYKLSELSGIEANRIKYPMRFLIESQLKDKLYWLKANASGANPFSLTTKEVAPPVVSKLGIPDLNKQLLSPCNDLCKETNGVDYIRPLTKIIIHLNDRHRWSREKIADWLDEIHDKGLVDLTMKEK